MTTFNKTATVVVAPGVLPLDEATKIAKAYGCAAINREWTGGLGEIMPSTLLLTMNEGMLRQGALSGRTFGFPVRVVTYKVAIEMVKIDEETGA